MYLSQQEASWWENMRPVVICCGRVLSVTWGETSPGTSEEGMTQRRAPTPIKQATGNERQTAIYALLLLCIAQPSCTLSGVWFAPIPRSKFPGNAPGLTAFGLWDSTLDVIDQRHSEWAHTHSLFGADATRFFCFFRFIGLRQRIKMFWRERENRDPEGTNEEGKDRDTIDLALDARDLPVCRTCTGCAAGRTHDVW